MISSEVQRTLVKSPPELWAELSDPAALARHLGELGEIHIVRTEPERVVEWAAEHTTGVVSIKPSGWGTRVTLSATRERAAEPDIAGAAPQEPVAESDAAPEHQSAAASEHQSAAEPEHQSAAEPELAAAPNTPTDPQPAAEAAPDAAPEPAVQPELATESTAVVDVLVPQPDVALADSQAGAPEPRRGFFARLFRRRGRTERTPAVEPSPERPDAFAAVRQVLAPETFAAMHPFAAQAAAPSPAPTMHSAIPAPTTDSADAAPTTDSAPDAAAEPAPEAQSQSAGEPSSDIAAELMAAEDVTADEVSAAEVTAVLTAVLDRLGAAHHRPFSRG
jgi:hypothetical protein